MGETNYEKKVAEAHGVNLNCEEQDQPLCPNSPERDTANMTQALEDLFLS